jgi:hypothetical protein
MAIHRNRVIYQSEALFISPDSTGAHFTGCAISNSENAGAFADISANIGDGPFGLFTPPKNSQQIFGGTQEAPAKNRAGNIVGWQPGDEWPEWSPNDTTVSTSASFNGNVNDVSNSDTPTNVSITAAQAGPELNITLTGDGVSTINDLIAALDNPSNYTVAEGSAVVPANGVQVAIDGGTNGGAKAHGTIIQQLKRVQTANYGFTLNKTDVNQFGHMSRLDSIVLESPTVNLDFSYYILDGFNERQIEFVTNGQINTLSGHLNPELYQAGNNYFILTTPEARDAVQGDVFMNENGTEEEKTVISLGNGYITDYSVDISVGSIPTASVTVEGMNIRSDYGTTGNDIPGIDMRDGSLISAAWDKDANGVRTPKVDGCTGLYSLPPATSGYAGCGIDHAALRPGDVVLNLKNSALFSKLTSGNANEPLLGSAHVQSASISVPMSRTTLQRLGTTFGFSKAVDVPMTVTMSVSALVSEIKEGSIADLLCSCESFDLELKIFDPNCMDCVTLDENLAMTYVMKGVELDSESFSSSIGDNKTVELSFSTQIGGPEDKANGLFISGKEQSEADVPGFPPAWTGIGGKSNVPASGLMGYRA